MDGFLRKLRGIVSLGGLGGVAGALTGSIWWLLEVTIGMGSLSFGSAAWAIGLWSGFGAFAAIGASLLLTRFAEARSVAELSTLRVSLLGGFWGGLAPLLLVLSVGLGISVETLLFAVMSAGLGAGITGGLTLIAKSADDAELGAGSDRDAIASRSLDASGGGIGTL